jgi:hypothetical protein
MHDFPHVEVVKITAGIVFLGDLGKDEFCLPQFIRVHLAALQHQPGFLKVHVAPVGLHRGESGFGHLVAIASRFAAADLQGLAVILGEETEGKAIVPVGKSKGVALGSDPGNGNGQVPHDAQVAPAGGHGVELFDAPGGHQHPVLVEQFKDVVGNVGGFDVGEIVHGQGI